MNYPHQSSTFADIAAGFRICVAPNEDRAPAEHAPFAAGPELCAQQYRRAGVHRGFNRLTDIKFGRDGRACIVITARCEAPATARSWGMP